MLLTRRCFPSSLRDLVRLTAADKINNMTEWINKWEISSPKIFSVFLSSKKQQQRQQRGWHKNNKMKSSRATRIAWRSERMKRFSRINEDISSLRTFLSFFVFNDILSHLLVCKFSFHSLPFRSVFRYPPSWKIVSCEDFLILSCAIFSSALLVGLMKRVLFGLLRFGYSGEDYDCSLSSQGWFSST